MHLTLRVQQMLAFCAIFVAALGSSAQARNTAEAADLDLRIIRAILEQPEQKIDLARAKLTIDRMIDPTIDVDANLKRLDRMVRQIKSELPPNATSGDRVGALREFLYQDGLWNNNQGFRYDFDDPLGHDVRNKLLPTYLATKRGNCISMPFLFIVLGQRLGIDVTAVQIPAHVFVKYRDEAGNSYNIEATNGGHFARDAFYKEGTPMTAEALANGVYMRSLNKRETVVLMMETLEQVYSAQGRHADIIALTKLALEYDPRSVRDMVYAGNAYYDLMKLHFMDKYAGPDDVPSSERPYMEMLRRNRVQWGEKPIALGWRPPAPASDANYLEYIERVKSTQ